MHLVTTNDGIEIFYKDWGPRDARPIVFHHGWPLSADDWDAQMLYFLSKGCYQIVPIADSALLSARLLRRGTLKVYEGYPHGMCTTHADVLNPDLLAFIEDDSWSATTAAAPSQSRAREAVN